jgi:ubiquitin-protein ligase
MDISRIHREFGEAQARFQYLELHPTSEGTVYAKTALQTPIQMYVLSIRFPDNYPNEMPRVYVDAPHISNAPHMYRNGNICYMHPSMWNPGIHNLSFVIGRAAKWLNKFEVWRHRGKWPGAELLH